MLNDVVGSAAVREPARGIAGGRLADVPASIVVPDTGLDVIDDVERPDRTIGGVLIIV